MNFQAVDRDNKGDMVRSFQRLGIPWYQTSILLKQFERRETVITELLKSERTEHKQSYRISFHLCEAHSWRLPYQVANRNQQIFGSCEASPTVLKLELGDLRQPVGLLEGQFRLHLSPSVPTFIRGEISFISTFSFHNLQFSLKRFTRFSFK